MPQMEMMLMLAFLNQVPGKPLPRSTVQDLTPDSGGKKIEPFPNISNLEMRIYGNWKFGGKH
jgi:hypothetical protein